MRKYLFILLILTALTSVTSCSDETPNDEAALYDIACLESMDNSGSVFTLCAPGSDDLITLKCPQKIDPNIVETGDRLLIRYVPADGIAYKSGGITLTGYSTIVNGTLSTLPDEELNEWDKTPVYLLSCWRSGRYLNIHARLPYDDRPRAFTLAMAENPSDPAFPDLYLVHAVETDVATFSRAYYASFDISALTTDPAVKGFTLHINNSNLNLPEIPFYFPKAMNR